MNDVIAGAGKTDLVRYMKASQTELVLHYNVPTLVPMQENNLRDFLKIQTRSMSKYLRTYLNNVLLDQNAHTDNL